MCVAGDGVGSGGGVGAPKLSFTGEKIFFWKYLAAQRLSVSLGLDFSKLQIKFY